ncbi:efflux RND transporter permease subunit [Tranquillimonas alkanivorans]|uniref:Multidrug efflux pump n=1 Tax=Tranquillimonas alkanivorans TaxID=441119 RepID=A0A1I5NRI8_9RHOB|nr:efflux RND transporter permease subunit [Tranquillimonas alkanivorans]SFP24382.1 multidrug efflux pump [Tranquillimonas alkanivorans]
MTGIVDWAASRARMVLAFIALSLVAGGLTYASLPKEGEPDIEVPALFVSVPFPGISAEDAEKLILKPMETELSDLDGLEKMSGTAAEGYAGLALEFEFGWDKTKVIADVRDRMNTVEADFPEGADKYSINEINFSEFPIIIVSLTGAVPERMLLRVAEDLQDRLEGLEPVLEAALAGHREEMLEVVIDPLRLEAYNVTAAELIQVVQNNNQLIAAGEVETESGAFSVKIPSSFDDRQDVYDLPVKVNGDRVVTLGDLADIRLTFEDRTATARFNGETTVALQVVKRKGFNIIDTAALVREEVAAEQETWPPELREAISVATSNDQSRTVESMVSQLEGSVLTAIALVMIVVLAALGIRSALLVGFAIPTSFLLCFVLLGVMGITISNIVMFGLILAVGMLVDGAIVVVEYADRRISEGSGPMAAYTEAAKRMFWPIVSSTATTLCAFLPMLFWPGVAGEFMGMLPVTLIFVLCASLIVALVYLPVMGGVAGRISRLFDRGSGLLRGLPWLVRAALVVPAAYLVFLGAMQVLNPHYLFPGRSPLPEVAQIGPGAVLFLGGAILTAITLGAAKIERAPRRIRAGHRRTPFGWVIKVIAGNPVMPLVAVGGVIAFVVAVFGYYGENNRGVEFFVDSEPEQALVYVRARGNLSLPEKDALLREAEEIVLDTPGVQSAFAFAGDGGLESNTGGAEGPRDSIGQVQIELVPWDDRPTYAAAHPDEVTLAQLDGDVVLDTLQARLDTIPGIRTEILNLAMGPASAKPVHLRLMGEDWEALLAAAETARARFDATPGLLDVEDSRPLPGIDWQIDVDVEKAGRYGADVATVGGMVQLVTRGILLDTMRVPSSDDEIEIRVRLPEEDRVLSTLDSLKVRTRDGLVPLSNFISRQPVAKLGQIDRVDQQRYFDVRAAVAPGLSTVVADGEVLATVHPDTAEGDPGLPVLARVEGPDGEALGVVDFADGVTADALSAAMAEGAGLRPLNANERIGVLTEWLETEAPLPDSMSWEWTGDQEDQEESGQFLMKAFAAALMLMFIILLAQFNSFYNAFLVLLAVVLSVAGVLIGMLVMGQPFSIIMTGTGIVALAGIVVNNNIVLIDTYQDYARYMPRIEAIVRTAEDRIRPVLLTTITTMAGLAPMMLGISLDFIGGGYTIDSPTALWWKQLATAVVFGLGVATVLTLVFTPSMLALRVWLSTGAYRSVRGLRALSLGRGSRAARDLALNRAARKVRSPEILWEVDEMTTAAGRPAAPLRAAE